MGATISATKIIMGHVTLTVFLLWVFCHP